MLLNCGKSALFRPKKHDQFWSCFFPSFSPFFASQWPKYAVVAFQKGKKVGRKRGLCHFLLFSESQGFLLTRWPKLLQIQNDESLTPELSPAQRSNTFTLHAREEAETVTGNPEGAAFRVGGVGGTTSISLCPMAVPSAPQLLQITSSPELIECNFFAFLLTIEVLC